MNIAYLVNQYPKVSHSFIRREIHALERQGIAVTRIALRGWNEDLVDPEDLLERKRTRYVLRDGALVLIIAVLRTVLTRPVLLWRAFVLACRMAVHAERALLFHLIYVAEACRIRFWLDEHAVKHLHAHFGTNSAEVAMLVHVLGGPPWSFTVHGPEEFDKPHFIRLAEKIRRSAFVVAISSFGRSQLYRLVDSDCWAKIHVVRCGLEPKFHQLSSFPKIASKQFLCVGRLCEQKGQLLLLEATRRLATLGVQIDLVLAGDGEMRKVIDEFITMHKLQVRVTGWISSDQVREHILGSRALVLPSFAEGLPVVIMEAMALQRPIISTYVAGIPELVVAGEDGWLVPAGDVEALMTAMQACLETSEGTLTAMGQAGRERVLVLHDSDKEACKLLLLFQDVTRGNIHPDPVSAD